MADRDVPSAEPAVPSPSDRGAPGEPSRRAFLGRAAALAAGAAAFGALTPADLVAVEPDAGAPLPKAKPRPPLASDEPIRIGIIGTGGMGTEHTNGFARLAQDGRATVHVVALCDVCQPRLDNAYVRLTARQPDSKVQVDTYTDYRRLLEDPTIHGVLIATPEHWHGRMAEHAIAAGKDVYVEKPMTLGFGEAVRLYRLLERNPETRLLVGTQHVMEPSYGEARRLIAEGVIGTPVSSQTSYCRNSKEGEWTYYPIEPEWDPDENLDWRAWCGPLGRQPWDPEVYARWRRYRRYSTGIIGDLLVHRIVPLMQALEPGWPVRVVASGSHVVDKAMENHDQVNLTIEFETGHIMTVLGSTANEVGLETLVRGHRGNLYLSGRRLTLRPERIYAEELDEESWDGPEIRSSHDEMRVHWLDIIRNRGEPVSDVELNLRVMAIVEMASRSMWEGKALRAEPHRPRIRNI